jgi:hypothetical protein
MLDDPLHEQLADWVRPVTTLPVPDIRVLRRRARRRGMRRAATAAAITAAAAAVAVGVIAGLPGTGRSEGGRPVQSWSAAPGTWTHGVWRPAGPQPAADAGPSVAPYIVLSHRGTAQVRDVFTSQTMASMPPPDGVDYGGMAAAGDDRTFVLETVQGLTPGQHAFAGFYELRVKADGRMQSLALLFRLQTNDGFLPFAISQDARMLAYSTGNGLETVSLATGQGRSWPAPRGGVASAYSLSWAGDRTLAFEWMSPTRARLAGAGIRLLDVMAPGMLVQASRLIVPYGRYCSGTVACQDGQLITPDGSKMLVTKVVVQGQNYRDSVVEYSTRTGVALAAAVPAFDTPYAGPPCVPLWTDPSGVQVMSYCGGHGQWYDRGHVSRVKLDLPMYGMNFGSPFTW